MLDELSSLQEDDEEYRLTSMSFSVETRSEDGRELVQKTYTFTWGEQFDEWQFSAYEEKRSDDTRRMKDRDWRVSRNVWWEDTDQIDVEIPQIVSNKLAERLSCDEVTISL